MKSLILILIISVLVGVTNLSVHTKSVDQIVLREWTTDEATLTVPREWRARPAVRTEACRQFASQDRGKDAPVPSNLNIVLIMADDMGYGDWGPYDHDDDPSTMAVTDTPALDRMAAEGVTLTDFYVSASICTPVRSALLTGRYQIRTGMTRTVYPNDPLGLDASEITLAEMLKDAGYVTAIIGKWHLGDRPEYLPTRQGFDYYFGTLGANDGGGVKFHENNDPAGGTRDMGSLIRTYTDKAIDYLKNKRDPKKPFVLYVAHTMMHTIIDASPKFRGKSAGDLYGDVVEEFDYETGRLLDTLDELKLTKDTLVIYTTDNGPWNQRAYTDRKKGHPKGSIFWGESGPLRNGKGSSYEGGLRAPCITRWPGKVPKGRTSDAIFATIGFMPTFATLAGYKVPADRVIDGVDQTALLLGKSKTGARDNFFYQTAMRKGKWKYLKAKHCMYGYARDKKRKQVEELYDLEADLGETTNLAAKFPKKVAELKKLMADVAKATVQ